MVQSSFLRSAIEERWAEDRWRSVEWARHVLADPRAVVFDSETTGIVDAEIVEVCVYHLATSSVLYNYRVRPVGVIEPAASAVTGIWPHHVDGCPGWDHYGPILVRALSGFRVVVYNVGFDYYALRRSCSMAGFASGLGDSIPENWDCAMRRYAAFVGDWNIKRGDYRWPKLPSAGHSALADCKATERIIREMGRG
jgi:hypothetical protein